MSRGLPAWVQPSGEPDWSSRNNPWDTSRFGAPTQQPPRPDTPTPSELTLRPLNLITTESPSQEESSVASSLLLLALGAVRSLAQQTSNATQSPIEESRFETKDSVEEASSHAKSQTKWAAINDGDTHMIEASAVDEDLVEAPADGAEDLVDDAASNNEDRAKAPGEELNDDEGPAEGAASEDESPEPGKRRPGRCKDCSMPAQGESLRCAECKRKHLAMQQRRAYARYKEEGKCPKCMRKMSTKESALCAHCTAVKRAAYQKAKEENKCYYCKIRDAQNGRTVCAECDVSRRAYRQAATDRARSQGKCRECKKNEAAEGGTRCEACRAYRREEYRRRRKRLRRIAL